MTSQDNQPGPRGLQRTVAPTFRAIDLSQLKLQARIDGDDEDILLLDYIDAATDYIEGRQGRCLRQSTWQAVYDGWPSCGVYYLAMPPLVSVSSVAYLDAAGVSQTLSSSVYAVDAISQPGRLALAYAQSWPTLRQQLGVVTITYIAGHASAALIPPRTRQAIRVLAAHWFKSREPIVVGMSVAEVPLSVNEIIEADMLVSYR